MILLKQPTTTASFIRCKRRGSATVAILLDLCVGALLAAVLAGVYMHDRAAPADGPPEKVVEPVDPEPESAPPPPPEIIPPKATLPPVDPVPRIALGFSGNDRFGIVTTSGNPEDTDDDNQRITYSPDGATNNTRISIDGQQPMLGQLPVVTPVRKTGEGQFHVEWQAEGVRITRTIRLVAGDVSRRMDEVEVTYVLVNNADRPHIVGLREMLDCLIGNNDGVPFIVPGNEGIVTGPRTYRGRDVPDFVRALERADLANPGVIVDVGLRVGQGERPIEVVLSHWPGSDAEWNYDRSREFGRDSAVGIYYENRPLPPGESRSLSYSYGLGTISSTRTKNAKLSLTAGGPFHAGGKFWMTALVQNPRAGQNVRLILPEGLAVAPGHSEMKPVAATDIDFTQLSWLILVARSCVGDREVEVILDPEGAKERQMLSVQPPEARLSLVSRGVAVGGKAFWISALVRNPKAGQSVELTTPAGVALATGHAASKTVSIDKDVVQINWLVRAASKTSGRVEFRVKLQPDAIEDACEVDVEAGSLIR